MGCIMSVRKPLEKIEEKSVDIDKLISRGAQVIEDSRQENETEQCTFINLRVPNDMLKEINAAVKKRVGIRRTGWMLEAFHEKLHGKQ